MILRELAEVIFVSIESKGVRFSVSGLESAVTGGLVSADSKGVISQHNIGCFRLVEKKNADEMVDKGVGGATIYKSYNTRVGMGRQGKSELPLRGAGMAPGDKC